MRQKQFRLLQKINPFSNLDETIIHDNDEKKPNSSSLKNKDISENKGKEKKYQLYYFLSYIVIILIILSC